jgi:hypothetical protein
MRYCWRTLATTAILAALIAVSSQASLVNISGARSSSSSSSSSSSGGGVVDLTSLPSGGASAAADTTDYAALNVQAMAAGASFNDPVTGVRTVKVTANGTPASAQFANAYSTLGLQISQAWGAGGDQYTLWFMSTSGTAYLCDYQLGGTTSNYRAGPGGEARVAFSRLPGNERIIYVSSSTQLRRYNTETNAYADTGSFPYSWTTAGNNTTWLQLNVAETWATAVGSVDTTATALNLTTGSVITLTSQTGLNDIYIGDGNFAFLNRTSNSRIWDLDANSSVAIEALAGRSAPFHVSAIGDYWTWINTNATSPNYPIMRATSDGAIDDAVVPQGYWNQIHTSGHWKNGSGTDRWFLVSTWSGGIAAWMEYNNIFYNVGSGATKVLGGHYSDSPATTADSYRSQPHSTQSDDGKLVMFTSNMLDGARTDVIIMEVPTS